MAPKRVVNVGGYSLRGAFVDVNMDVHAAASSSSADADQVVPEVAIAASADVSYLSHTVAQILNQEAETADAEPEDETEGMVAPKAKAKAKAKAKGAAKAKAKGAAKAKAKAIAKAKAPPLPPLTGTAKNLDCANATSLRAILTLLSVDTAGPPKLTKRELCVKLADLLGELPDEEEEADEEEVAAEEVADEEEGDDEEADYEEGEADDDL